MDSTTQAAFLGAAVPVPSAPHDTLDDILISEPAVSRILADARKAYCHGQPTDWREYTRLKRELEQYVGWTAHRHQLRNAACWTIAHSALVDAIEGASR